MKKYKLFRDPIYGIIKFDKIKEGVLLDLIDSPEFQRLKRIRQLGFCHYTYPSAIHGRFTHSIGVCHLVGIILQNLNFAIPITIEDEDGTHKLNKDQFTLLMKIAALLHDVGHGPFSHAFEKVNNVKHDILSAKIITDSSTTINKLLSNISTEQFDGNLIKWIVDLINGTFSEYSLKWAGDLISSQFDADRIDYLLRDSYMCGVKYVRFDWEWLVNNMEIADVQTNNKVEQCLLINASKGIHSLESFLISRFHMYEQVYYHKTINGIDVLANKFFKRFKELIDNNKIDESIECAEYLISFLKDNSDIKSYLKLDDFYMITLMNVFSEKCTDDILKYISNCFINRTFYKMIRQSSGNGAFDFKDIQKLNDTFKGLSDEISKYYILESNYSNNPYSDKYLLGKDESILVIDNNGEISELSAMSDIVKGLRNNIQKVNRTYLSPEYAQKYLNS